MSLRADNLAFAYEPGRPVLDGVSLEVEPGRIAMLFGPNGSGKSTLLRCLNGGLQPTRGNARVDGLPVGALDPLDRARRIAVVPQDERQYIPFTVFETVMLGRHPYGGMDPEADRRATLSALERLELLELAARPFPRLSGGERRRVLIARALAQGGSYLLLDEPEAHLDHAFRLRLLSLLRELANEGRAVLMAAHDLVFAPTVADECILLARGIVAARGPPAEALAPAHLGAAYEQALSIEWRSDGEIRVRTD